MIKGKDILGRPVVAISNGQKVETVQDIVFDHQGNRVLALLVEEGGWFRAAKVVPFDRIQSIGEHAVMIASPEDITSKRKDDRLAEVLDSRVNLIGMALLTTDGQRLGRIADVYFDEKTGEVEGYEATEGFFADLTGGRTFVPAPESVQIGADAAIVPLSVAQAMQEQAPGGIKGVFNGAAGSVRGGVQYMADNAKDSYQTAAQSVKGAVENVADAAAERQQAYVVGKTAGQELVAPDGTVIVRKGETITPLHAEVAQWHGLLTALAANATGAALAGAYADTAANVQKSMQDTAASVREGWQHASGTVQERVDSLTDAGKDRQKELLIGKIASADVILDDGTVIVKKGDTISAAQADRAELGGKLAALTAAATGGALGGFLGNLRERVQDTLDDVKDAAADRQKAFVIGKTSTRDIQTDAGETIVHKGSVITQAQAERAEQTGTLTALMAAAELINPQPTALPDPASPEATVGRRVKTDVRTPSGSLVAAQGQIVTPAILERARHVGVEQDLLNATRSDAAQALAGAGAAVAGGLNSVQEGAAGLLDRAKAWIGERRDDAEAAIKAQEEEVLQARIKDALGHPVQRVILTPDDRVILNMGEVVTHQAVQEARAAGVLDMLLDSVG